MLIPVNDHGRRSAKKGLESKLGGVDLQRLNADHEQARKAEAALKAANEAHRVEVAALQAKLVWYTDNQRLIDEIDAEKEAALARVASLETQVHARDHRRDTGAFGSMVDVASGGGPADGARAEGGSDTGNGPDHGPVRMSDAERVGVLERQLLELQQLLEKRHALDSTSIATAGPRAGRSSGGGRGSGRGGGQARRGSSSLADLIAAAGPSADELQRTAYLQTRVEQLEAAAAATEGANQKRVRALRQQHERVAAGYEARLAALTERVSKAEAEDKARGGLAASRTRVRELEKQVEEIRAAHGKRVRELETKLAEAARDASRRAASAARAKASTAGASRAASGTTQLEAARTSLRSSQDGASAHTATTPAQTPADMTVPKEAAGAGRAVEDGSVAAVTYTAEECAAAASADDVSTPTATSAKHHEAVLAHVSELAETLAFSLARLEGGVALLDGAVSVRSEGGAAFGCHSMMVGPACSAASGACEENIVAALQAKLWALERRQRTREAEVADLLMSTKRVANLEAERARREMADVLERKNAEVDAFRSELDAIVLDIKLLHAQRTHAEMRTTRRQSAYEVIA